MNRNKLLFVLIPVLLLLLLLAQRYSASPSFPGSQFAEEATGHVGIYLEGDRVFTSDEEAVLVEGSTATIVKGGEYRLSGTLTDGQIIVDAPAEEQVVLKLDDVVLHCEHSAPIWARSADRVKLSLPEDSINLFSDGALYNAPDPEANMPTACIYAQCDLTIKGKGQLTVNAAFRNGIVSTDSLYLKNGVVNVTAPGTALRGKDDVTILDGTYELHSGGTAVTSAGFIDVQGGAMRIDADGSALQAFRSVTAGPEARISARTGLLTVQCSGTIELSNPIKKWKGG